MKKKTADLIGPALDWAVAYLEDQIYETGADFLLDHADNIVNYSTDWAQGGPIIERENITVTATGFPWWECEDGWYAHIGGDLYAHGGTPLVAAMRVYVMSKLGDEIDVPEELK